MRKLNLFMSVLAIVGCMVCSSQPASAEIEPRILACQKSGPTVRAADFKFTPADERVVANFTYVGRTRPFGQLVLPMRPLRALLEGKMQEINTRPIRDLETGAAFTVSVQPQVTGSQPRLQIVIEAGGERYEFGDCIYKNAPSH